MAKIIRTKITDFYGGISDDIRKTSINEYSISKHFDIYTNPKRLTPYRSLEADTNDGSTSTGMKQYYVRDFIYASGSSKLYGLGQTGAGLTKIVYKADATTGNWTLPASSEGNGAVKNGCFIEFKDYMWGFQGTNQLFKWGLLSGTPSITNSVTTVASTITSVAQGIIASDNNLYLPYNNTLVRIAPGLTVTDQAISIPTNYKITSLANYNTFLAIAGAPISPYNGVSKVFLWDLSSVRFFETIDFGEGNLNIIETVEGQIVGISDRYLNNSTGAGRGSMVIQTYAGGTPQLVKEIYTQKLTSIDMPKAKFVKNNRLFWACKVFTNSAGTLYDEGIWSFGRKNVNYPFALSLDIIDENVSTSGIQSIGAAGNYFFIAHSSDGSIDKTDDTSAYTFTSIHETQIFDIGDAGTEKALRLFTIITAPILAGTVTVKYRKDSETSWTTIDSYSTVGGISYDFYNIASTGEALPSFSEIQFRIESTGGIEITSYEFESEILIGSN